MGCTGYFEIHHRVMRRTAQPHILNKQHSPFGYLLPLPDSSQLHRQSTYTLIEHRNPVHKCVLLYEVMRLIIGVTIDTGLIL